MTKFIDNTTAKKVIKETVFKELLNSSKKIEPATWGPDDYETVEYIGYEQYYGDVFKASNGDRGYVLYFGVKGSEFDEQ